MEAEDARDMWTGRTETLDSKVNYNQPYLNGC